MTLFREPRLQALRIREVRNLERLKLDDLAPVTVISGANGSGKTSVLEAIHLLGMARPLRSAGMGPVIRRGASACAVHGALGDGGEPGAAAAPMEVEHDGERFAVRVAYSKLASTSELASYLPLQVISADTLQLVSGPPQLRRQLIDWGAFHLDPQFRPAWRRARDCLRQRNALLRRALAPADAELSAWSEEFGRWGSRVDALRRRCVEAFRPLFASRLESLAGHLRLGDMAVDYVRGWSEECTLGEALARAWPVDVARAHTGPGPHRAELRLRVDGQRAADRLSRGQQKLVAAALRLSLGDLLLAETGRRSVYLVDDLSAELDRDGQRRCCEILETVGSQAFVTSIDDGDFSGMWRRSDAVRRFRLSRGRLVDRDP